MHLQPYTAATKHTLLLPHLKAMALEARNTNE